MLEFSNKDGDFRIDEFMNIIWPSGGSGAKMFLNAGIEQLDAAIFQDFHKTFLSQNC